MAYFMQLAEVIKTRSPDPKTQVGAVLVDHLDRVVGTGYNGPPAGFPDSLLSWGERNEALYNRIVHAEMNAILYSGARYDHDSKLYCTMSPCKDCIKLIAAAGIKKIFFKEWYKDYATVSQLATEFNIQLVHYKEDTDG
jgi:dCMP deaminase